MAARRYTFTSRQNGTRMATTQLDLHIPEELALFVQRKLGLPSLSAAAEAIVEATVRHLTTSLSWHTPAIEEAVGEWPEELSFAHTDSLSHEGNRSEYSAVYEADPQIILNRPGK